MAGAASLVVVAAAIVVGVMSCEHPGSPSASPTGGATNSAPAGAPGPARGGPSGRNGGGGIGGYCRRCHPRRCDQKGHRAPGPGRPAGALFTASPVGLADGEPGVRAGHDAHHDGCGHHDQASRAGHQGLRVVQDPVPASGPGRAGRLRETLRTERACPIRHGQAMSQPGGRTIRQDPQHLLTEPRQQRGYRNRAREERLGSAPAACAPRRPRTARCPAYPLAHQHGELPVPAGQHRVQAGAGRATGPGHDQRAERAFELAARP